MKVVLLGGTGFLGGHVLAALRRRGDQVVVASRDPRRARERLPPDVGACAEDEGSLMAAFTGARAIVNLAGATIFGRRWTSDYKKEMLSSRVDVTLRIARTLAGMRADVRPGTLVNASAVGYYGDAGDDEVTEASPPGSDFLAQVCVAWEEAARESAAHGLRVVTPRFGVALGGNGGALAAMLTPFRLGLGGPPGSGRQWVSWIHVDDLAGLVLHAIDGESVDGAVNVVTANPVRMEHLCRALAEALRRPCALRVPEAVLRLALGEGADPMLQSVRALPVIALDRGFPYRFPTIEAALADLVGTDRATA